ncbi:MAG: O-antigen ligase family protein, partial [Chloroflexota bacterium]
AALAPTHHFEALKHVTRYASGLGIFLVTIQATAGHLPTTNTQHSSLMTQLLWAVCLGAGLSALVGLGEAAGLPGLSSFLTLFKVGPTQVGHELRLGATFQYATIAAMFFEMTLPLALTLAAASQTRPKRFLAVGIGGLCIVAAVLTLTRTSLVVMPVVLGLAMVLSRRPGGRPLRRPAATLLLVFGGAVVLVTTGSPTFRVRLMTENDQAWYQAVYVAPASVSGSTGEVLSIPITVRNTGQVTWMAAGEQAFALSYRWLTADGRRVYQTPLATKTMANDLAPGQTATWVVETQLEWPAGEYRLAWDMRRADGLPLRWRGVPEAETVIQVGPGGGAAALPPTIERGEPVSDIETVSRRELWWAAWQMFVDRPLLGHGPDNFRYLYGEYLTHSEGDTRLNANNLYLEWLADVGLIGTAAFGWLVWVVVRPLFSLIPEPVVSRRPPAALLVAGLGGSLFAFLLHGLLDAFLNFTPIYLLFWMVLGLTVAMVNTDWQN